MFWAVMVLAFLPQAALAKTVDVIYRIPFEFNSGDLSGYSGTLTMTTQISGSSSSIDSCIDFGRYEILLKECDPGFGAFSQILTFEFLVPDKAFELSDFGGLNGSILMGTAYGAVDGLYASSDSGLHSLLIEFVRDSAKNNIIYSNGDSVSLGKLTSRNGFVPVPLGGAFGYLAPSIMILGLVSYYPRRRSMKCDLLKAS